MTHLRETTVISSGYGFSTFHVGSSFFRLKYSVNYALKHECVYNARVILPNEFDRYDSNRSVIYIEFIVASHRIAKSHDVLAASKRIER